MLCCVLVFLLLAALLTRFNIYDADAFSPARFLFPRRAGASLNGTAYSTTSAAGRYQLPADMSGLQGMAAMMHRLQEMSDAYVRRKGCCQSSNIQSIQFYLHWLASLLYVRFLRCFTTSSKGLSSWVSFCATSLMFPSRSVCPSLVEFL